MTLLSIRDLSGNLTKLYLRSITLIEPSINKPVIMFVCLFSTDTLEGENVPYVPLPLRTYWNSLYFAFIQGLCNTSVKIHILPEHDIGGMPP